MGLRSRYRNEDRDKVFEREQLTTLARHREGHLEPAASVVTVGEHQM
ncbi:MAG: hypothetical protein ACYCRG_08285 [Acidimicrobiales bacterium]